MCREGGECFVGSTGDKSICTDCLCAGFFLVVVGSIFQAKTESILIQLDAERSRPTAQSSTFSFLCLMGCWEFPILTQPLHEGREKETHNSNKAADFNTTTGSFLLFFDFFDLFMTPLQKVSSSYLTGWFDFERQTQLQHLSISSSSSSQNKNTHTQTR